MEVTSLEIEEVKLLRPKKHGDARGYFMETWNRRTFAEAGVDVDFVQDNCSYSVLPSTIRGLHYQRPPKAQGKLVRVVRGAVFDVAVDLRRSSPTFGRFVSAVLSAPGAEQLYIPVGFAHGFCTLEPETEITYKTTDFYSPEHDTGIAWNDPDIAVDWPLDGREPVLSDKDRTLAPLSQTPVAF
jgi:dTDP-4-dehydrorhamnose 3,5-epimerase